MAKHHLKTWPAPFQAIWDRNKYWEIRKNDRDYRVGDTLTLQEWFPDHERWGERIIQATVKYILDGEFGLREGYVCMSLSEVRRGHFEADASFVEA